MELLGIDFAGAMDIASIRSHGETFTEMRIRIDTQQAVRGAMGHLRTLAEGEAPTGPDPALDVALDRFICADGLVVLVERWQPAEGRGRFALWVMVAPGTPLQLAADVREMVGQTDQSMVMVMTALKQWICEVGLEKVLGHLAILWPEPGRPMILALEIDRTELGMFKVAMEAKMRKMAAQAAAARNNPQGPEGPGRGIVLPSGELASQAGLVIP